ncbi:homocysteine S-methyltransferase family protein [Pseudenhygromyxa sp. WMMC2535]|uniref:homocysteine S-methyltransferase family protein n=1 Tax=Pseudenhygromyxa sp. WMMC2535 TaxID=2712867 RepID=UPI0015575657|nr:homocysteine S-methyltransferase family protein [Pseudenhygromyxa sp. WMMC2535]NVB41268.1 homocysteine S-methyltransferase family protein [Pseudenhygromyxa sp. WMMC2535]
MSEDTELDADPGVARDGSHGAVLLDGAMGTELSRRGFSLEAPLFSARALLDDPELIARVHFDYLLAGAQVLSTASFGLHARTLAIAGMGERQRELAARSVELLEAVRAHGRAQDPSLAKFRVAGAISPLPGPRLPEEQRELELAEYRALAEALIAAGADLILLETFTDLVAASRALEALEDLGEVPVWLAVVAGAPPPAGSRRPDGSRLLAGEGFDALMELAGRGRGRRPEALLVNCTQIDAIPAALEALVGAASRASWPGALGFYPHLGMRRVDGQWVERIVDDEVFAEQMQAWQRRWPQLELLGACCGSTPDYLAAMHRRFQPDAQTRERAWTRLAELVP